MNYYFTVLKSCQNIEQNHNGTESFQNDMDQN